MQRGKEGSRISVAVNDLQTPFVFHDTLLFVCPSSVIPLQTLLRENGIKSGFAFLQGKKRMSSKKNNTLVKGALIAISPL